MSGMSPRRRSRPIAAPPAPEPIGRLESGRERHLADTGAARSRLHHHSDRSDQAQAHPCRGVPDGIAQADDKDAFDDEKPQHPVRITRSFYLGVYEVTQAQYEAVMGNDPSYFSANGEGKEKVAGQSTDRHPVERSPGWMRFNFATSSATRRG